MKMKTNSNSYTIIYSAVIVVIVAFLLAFVSKALAPMQDANVKLDEKKQILNSLNIRNLSNEETEATYAKVVKSRENVENGTIFTCNVNGKTKYVFTVKGMGLWGPIKNTVYGVYFNHEGETAGLGAEIKDNQKWQEKFQGKKLFKNGDTSAIVLSVKKKVEDPASQVDAVTGATLTSNGVAAMLSDKSKGLGQYLDFLSKK